uniref:Secreted protein n=1 Tax=Schistosoma mansoni TaxID=6183 RepID=A0A5K4F4B1_SCHMA
MKLVSISLIGIFSLLISQEYGYLIDIKHINSPNQKQYVRDKMNLLNEYLTSRNIKKQFTEEEFSRLINSMLKKHIEDKNVDIRIIENKKDKHPTQKTSDTHTIKRTTPKPTTPKQINDGTSDKPKSIADFFLINKPKVPLWIVNPLYYMVEKFVQIMGYLLEDDDTLELNLPKYYYDKSI